MRFVNSELANVALIKAGSNVLITYRSSFNIAQDTNTMTECEWLALSVDEGRVQEWIVDCRLVAAVLSHASTHRSFWPVAPLLNNKHTPLFTSVCSLPAGIPAGHRVPVAFGGRVHGGWLRSVRQSWSQVEKVLRDDFGCRGANCRLFLTGHSRGGALATIVAAEALRPSLAALAAVHTFGGCRTGNREFQVSEGVCVKGGGGDAERKRWSAQEGRKGGGGTFERAPRQRIAH